jgi:beta-galactosidase
MLTRQALILALLAGAVQSADFFPMAVWYGGGKARAPMLEADPRSKKEDWRRDLQQIRKLGFNTIRCWIDWASGEPEENVFRFDTVEVLLDLAEQEGLKVLVQVYMDSAPAWVGRKYPDSLFVSVGGEVMHPESAPGYCVDHPGVRNAEIAFYTALAQRASKSPAFLGWDLWSEPHIINWADATYLVNPEFCYCVNSQARFRRWLRKKYGTLEALNKAWYRRFATWDEVQPSRLSTILSYSDYIDWRMFIQDKLGEDLRDRYDAVKRVAPDRVATSHAAAPGLFTSPLGGDGNPDDWIMRDQVDFWGTSFYPKHSFPIGRDVEWRGALLDFARSTGYAGGGKGFWIGELQAGFGTVALNVSGTVTPEDLKIWTWSAIARGAKGINYYAWYPMSTGYESGGFGMIRLDGSLTERSKVAGEIARVVDRNQELFLRARPPKAQVAIIYDPLSYMIGGRQRGATRSGPQSDVTSIERDSMLGVYRAWFPANVPVDFVHINRLKQSDLAQYKLIYLPYPLMIPSASAPELAAYVRNGGALVAEARLGWNNEYGRAAEVIPAMGLDGVMGCRESAVTSVPASRTELILENGDHIPARLYEETLQPEGAQARVIARFASGGAAAIESTFGKGKTLALGSYVGTAFQQQQTPAAQKFFLGLLDWAGVERPIRATGDPVEIRWLEAGRERLAFVFNHQSKPASVSIKGAEKGTDIVRGTPVSPGSLRLDAFDVAVIRIQ